MTLRTGELVCFMGPNGIGKSTLLRTIGGLQDPLGGEIIFDGCAARHFENVSVVLTEQPVPPNMTVYDLVSFGRYPHLSWNLRLSLADREIIEHAIVVVGIEMLAHTKLDQLSDGERQMAMIGRAVAQDTPVIILDEPTSHLDLNNRIRIMRFLKTLARTKSKAILIATHELDLALQTADILWLAGADHTIISGVPEDLILSGALDAIFQFKGYDLKTGKIDQEPHRGIEVQLKGEGYELRWTKNALERSGYFVSETSGKKIVVGRDPQLQWRIQNDRTYFTLAELLNDLKD